MTPPDPSPSSMITGGKEWDGPLLMNAILVAVERFSALKKARFGSETSAAAIRGMRLLLCLAGETDIDGGVIGELWRKRVPESVISNEGKTTLIVFSLCYFISILTVLYIYTHTHVLSSTNKLVSSVTIDQHTYPVGNYRPIVLSRR